MYLFLSAWNALILLLLKYLHAKSLTCTHFMTTCYVSLASEHGIAVTKRGTVYTWGVGQGLGSEFLPFQHEKVASEMDFFAMPTKVSKN